MLATSLNRVRDLVLTSVWNLAGTSGKPYEEQRELLERLLRRYPTWDGGHLLLAELALSQNDIGKAYAAAVCLLQLTKSAPSPELASKAELLLGQCFLRRGDWRSALAYLESAKRAALNHNPILEEIAAAQMLGGDYPSALKNLELIPSQHRTPQANAALVFVKSKIGPGTGQ